MFFVENASKRYYVTAEMMKRRYLFDIMLSLVGYLFRYISQHILEEWLIQLYSFYSYWNFAVWAAIVRNKNMR